MRYFKVEYRRRPCYKNPRNNKGVEHVCSDLPAIYKGVSDGLDCGAAGKSVETWESENAVTGILGIHDS